MRWGSCWRLTALAMISSKAGFDDVELSSPIRRKVSAATGEPVASTTS
jgi:hypothetical protein